MRNQTLIALVRQPKQNNKTIKLVRVIKTDQQKEEKDKNPITDRTI